MGPFFSLQGGDKGIHSLWKGTDKEWVFGWFVLLSCREGPFQKAVKTANWRFGLRFSLKTSQGWPELQTMDLDCKSHRKMKHLFCVLKVLF